ncbi:MAG TPA: DNA polymerase III subunit delta [Arenimonas sp.]|uniref:DNA polymerase III subunit delta n=1 Tax=Arenimonas sp. TaxID=1872635 RepID=UPI002D0ECC1A|nr:DNA polymerase III subunit delta [Arenimonas sp.]HMB55846.1 DNA polymerase III subunit delta [Arenimonas sp.]
MELRPDRFERQLAGEPLRPVYLIAGSEPLLVQECADALRAKARAEGFDEREVFDAEGSFDWNTLSMGMATLSLFATRRVFDLRLPTGKPGRDGAEAISAYCNNPPPDTVLLITAQDWSKSHAGKWSEAIARVGHVVPIWPVKPHELLEWLQKRLRLRGLVATPQATALLAERVEGNLLAAAQEIDKLALLAPGEQIDEAAMDRFVADSARFDVFKLVEAALAGDALRATRMLHALKAEGEQVPGLVPILAMEVLRLGQLARVQADGGNVMNAMREARIWENKQALYRRAIDRHPAPRWEVFVGETGRIDRIAKGRESGDAWLALERLLVAIAETRARRLLVS